MWARILPVMYVVVLLALALPALLLYATSGRTRCKDVRATTRKLVRYGLYVQLVAAVPVVLAMSLNLVAGVIMSGGLTIRAWSLRALVLTVVAFATLALPVATPIVALQYLNAVEASDATDCATVDVGRRRALVAMGAVLLCAGIGFVAWCNYNATRDIALRDDFHKNTRSFANHRRGKARAPRTRPRA